MGLGIYMLLLSWRMLAMAVNNYNVVLRKLISEGTKIPLEYIYKQAQNDGFTPPKKDINWASYRLVSATPEPYPFKYNQKLTTNYILNYNISIYGDDNFLLFQKFNAYMHKYQATILMHHNDMQFRNMEMISTFDELVNNIYYPRLDININLVSFYKEDNLGYIDKDTIQINVQTERG